MTHQWNVVRRVLLAFGACVRQGASDETVDGLEQAFDRGADDVESVRNDVALASPRSDPRFAALLTCPRSAP